MHTNVDVEVNIDIESRTQQTFFLSQWQNSKRSCPPSVVLMTSLNLLFLGVWIVAPSSRLLTSWNMDVG